MTEMTREERALYDARADEEDPQDVPTTRVGETEERRKMKIWLQRATHPGEVGVEETCGICGIEFERGVVRIDALTDERYEIGPMCEVCLDYFSRRQAESAVAHGWPSREKYVDAVLRYLVPMVGSKDELPDDTDPAEYDEFYRAVVIHR